MKKPFTSLSLVLSCILGVSPAFGEVKPNGLFCNDAVLQQGAEIPVWGTAREGEVVTVEIENQKVSTTTKDGKWMVRLQSLKVGGPYVMKISGDKTIVLNNLLVGEVWLCSGQSNMGRELGQSKGGPLVPNLDTEVAAAQYPQLRYFKVRMNREDEPQIVVSGSWQTCTPESVLNLSAVGYFFGSELHKSIKVPVGLIVSAVGGSPAEAWTPRDVLEKDFPQTMKSQKPTMEGAPPNSTENPDKPVKDFKLPSGLYNGMIHPLLPYAIRGVIWYQGEANNRQPESYGNLFSAMIGSWRKAWGLGEFPFLFVQLAPYRSLSPEICEEQLLVWKTTSNTSMVTTTDVGDAKSIHPGNKRPVGERLARAARALAYGENLEYGGPRYESMAVLGSQAIVTFSHSNSGLISKDGELKGFFIAGDDLQFVPAKAKIQGNTVIVSSNAVPCPKAVRYGWDSVPDVNLYNKSELPASTFRTDLPR